MKNRNLIIAAGLALSAFFVGCTPSRVTVRTRPTPPPAVVVRPAAPYPGAVWVAEDWRWRRGRYQYVSPHYVRPKASRVYVPGYWTNGPRGHVWVRGYWR